MTDENDAKKPDQPIAAQPNPVAPISSQQTDVVPASHSTEEIQNKTNADRPKWTDITMAVFTLALFLAAVIQAAIFYRQWKEMQSGGTDTHDLAIAAGKQADRTKELADHMKDQADQTKSLAESAKTQATQAVTQAQEATVAAQAAKRAADIAKETLHISERAYVFAGTMRPDFSQVPGVLVPLFNSGHIPSGEVDIVVYEQSFPMTPPGQAVVPESHWQSGKFATLPPGQPFSFIVIIPGLTQDSFTDFEKNREPFVAAGTISYNDGFPNTPQQESRFCFQGAPDTKLQHQTITPCDPDVQIPRLKITSQGHRM
jgi:hypothetical protein